MVERARLQQDLLFPDYAAERLWHRTTHDGFCTLPRTLPLVMQAIDMESKGQPAGHTLFCLWVRSPDQPLVTIENPAIFAAEAGFHGERAVDTWRRRMRKLKELGAIDAHNGASGDFHYVLLLNPNAVMAQLHKDKRVQKDLYARFTQRVMEIGAYADLEAIQQLWAAEDSEDSL